MKTKIKIKNKLSNNVLFEFKKENNSIKDTVEEAIKRGVDLSYANLCGVDLSSSYLYGANLRDANLSGTKLCGAILCEANLCGTNLCGTNLRGADLSDANLCGADLSFANLCGTKLCDANLRGADLRNTNNIPYIPYSCPSDGSFIGWKKVSTYKEDYRGNYLIKLEIPEDARRCSAISIKCRCDKAKVLSITNIESGEAVDVITNLNEKACVYKVGKMVYPDYFDDNRWNECSHGIHFFVNKQSAINY